MVIFGWRTAEIASEPVVHACVACGGESARYMAIQKYAHVYWIPFFPMGKTHLLQCEGCGNQLEKEDLPEASLETLRVPMGRARTPVWTFSAFAVIAFVLGAVHLNDKRREGSLQSLQLDPRPGDLVVLRSKGPDPKHPFVVARVNRVEGEALDVAYSKSSYESLESAQADLSRGGPAGPGDKYFSERNSALAKKTFAELDVRHIERRE